MPVKVRPGGLESHVHVRVRSETATRERETHAGSTCQVLCCVLLLASSPCSWEMPALCARAPGCHVPALKEPGCDFQPGCRSAPTTPRRELGLTRFSQSPSSSEPCEPPENPLPSMDPREQLWAIHAQGDPSCVRLGLDSNATRHGSAVSVPLVHPRQGFWCHWGKPSGATTAPQCAGAVAWLCVQMAFPVLCKYTRQCHL